MANYGGKNYTSFQNINLRGTGGTPGAFRMETTGGFESTLGIGTTNTDANYSYSFPNKSGTFPIMGTFTVQFPVITSTSNVYSTIVTVPGIRTEDALVVQLNNGNHATRDMFAVGSGATARILNAVFPGNGNITMGFFNNGLTTGYTELIYSYLAMR